MKQFVRFGAYLTMCAFAALAADPHTATAQKDQSSRTGFSVYQCGTVLQWTAQADGGGTRGDQNNRTVITVRKFKPRSTQPTCIADLFFGQHDTAALVEPKHSDRTVMHALILNSTLIIPVLELKKSHTMTEQKIYPIVSDDQEIYTA